MQLTITCSGTGSGGREYCLNFQGLGPFHDINAMLKHTILPDATPDDTRQALVEAVKLGLVPYVARTRLRDYLRIDFTPPTAARTAADPWHNWVFSLSISGWAEGDESYDYYDYCARPEVKRITEHDKLSFNASVAATGRRFMLDPAVVTARTRSYDAGAAYGRKLGDHLALGGWLYYNTSDYDNIRYCFMLGPKIEYDLVPYSEYVRHKVYIRLVPFGAYASYFDTTLYGRLDQFVAGGEVLAGVNLNRSWGSASFSADGSCYLHDLTKNRLSLYAGSSFRVIAGLSVSLSGGYKFIHDQLTLRKAGATEKERLLRLREMATSYSYWASVGVTYTFGSAFANIVNPIF